MISFKNFINKENNKLIKLKPSSSEIESVISNKLSVLSIINLSDSEKDKFSKKVANLASSEEVLIELSETIGTPNKEETEDEFVNRAKSTMASILRKKLLK